MSIPIEPPYVAAAKIRKAGSFSDSLSYWIDLFRWTGAFAVVLAHAGNRFVQSTDTIPAQDRNGTQTLYAFLQGFSHLGIMIFFVISGFLVGGTVWREAKRTAGIDLRRFLGRRLIRLWIVILPALLVTYIFDTWGASQGGAANEIYTNVKSHGFGAALCNVTFLQTLACDPYGTDGALWTLYCEFWYYLLFVAGVMLYLGNRYSQPVRAGLIAFILIVAVTSVWQREGTPLIPYFLIWLSGAAAANTSRVPARVSAKLLLGLLLGMLVAFRVGMGLKMWDGHGLGAFAFDLVSMGSFALLLAIMRFRPLKLPRPIAITSAALANFSFTLYCFHVPTMNLLAALMMRRWGVGWRDVSHGVEWLRLVAQLSLVMLFAWIIGQLTEARTDAVRRFFFKR